jgi:CRISPR/Cas system-associated endonuclease Cas1
MRELLNTLYVQTPGTVLHLDHDAVLARHEGEPVGRVPLRRIMGIAVIGRVSVTPSLIHRCAGDGVSISWFSQRGRHSGTLRGRTSGNVLLRLAQYRHHDDEHARLELARTICVSRRRTRCGRCRDAGPFRQHQARIAAARSIQYSDATPAAQSVQRCPVIPVRPRSSANRARM